MADKNGLLETAKGGIFFRKKKTRIIVNRNFSEWINRPKEEPFLWPPHLPRAYAFHVCVEDQKCRRGRTELGEWAELWQSRDTNPRTKRCYAYNILHFRLFLPYYRPCRFVFFLGGRGLMDYGGGGSGTRGTKTYTVRGKTYRPYLSADGYREDGVASWYGRDFHGKPRPTANAIICMR